MFESKFEYTPHTRLTSLTNLFVQGGLHACLNGLHACLNAARARPPTHAACAPRRARALRRRGDFPRRALPPKVWMQPSLRAARAATRGLYFTERVPRARANLLSHAHVHARTEGRARTRKDGRVKAASPRTVSGARSNRLTRLFECLNV